MDQEKNDNQAENKDRTENSEKKEQRSSASGNGTGSNRQEDGENRALGNQTDMGDQTAKNVEGDQPTQTPADDEKRRDTSVSHSNSTADQTSRSAYGTKGGRMDSGGVASSGSDKNPEGPSDPMTSRGFDKPDK